MAESPYIKDVDAASFQTDVIERSQAVPVVVDLWAEWCEPCKQLSPLLERVTDEYDGAFELAKIDVDANPQISQAFRVQGIPSVFAIVDGQPVAQFSGAIPEQQLREWLGQFVQPPADDRMVEVEQLLEMGADQAAEAKLEALIVDEPDNKEAVLTLAGLRIDLGKLDEANALLDTLPPSTDVDRLRAAASLTSTSADVEGLRAAADANPEDGGAQVDFARALAASGEFEAALERLLPVVTAKGDDADAAREAMVEVFNLLGSEHPIVGPWRRRLASALF
ncbi:MAG: tetratricopeptide repeat protein [Acidimicrobiia bacterium]|nr:tetratricopeptide repeat protein [Acidimicrobiia bacterium]